MLAVAAAGLVGAPSALAIRPRKTPGSKWGCYIGAEAEALLQQDLDQRGDHMPDGPDAFAK
jgi:hypothetical protein